MILTPDSDPRGVVLFAPGAGGNPTRYHALLRAARDAGFIVAAPEHERFDVKTVTDEQVRERAERLVDALRETGRDDVPVFAVGHSVGGWAALCLAGAQPWSRDGHPLPVPVEPRVSKVIAFAPTLGWFQAQGALDHLHVPVVVMTGTADTLTPPASVTVLHSAPATISVRTYDGVGHLDFLSELPPGVSPTQGLDHSAFIATLTNDFLAELG